MTSEQLQLEHYAFARFIHSHPQLRSHNLDFDYLQLRYIDNNVYNAWLGWWARAFKIYEEDTHESKSGEERPPTNQTALS